LLGAVFASAPLDRQLCAAEVDVTAVWSPLTAVKLTVRTLLSATPSPSPACSTKFSLLLGTYRVQGMFDKAVAPESAFSLPVVWEPYDCASKPKSVRVPCGAA